MVDAAMHADLEELTEMRLLFGADTDGTSATFSSLVDQFRQVKRQVLAGS